MLSIYRAVMSLSAPILGHILKKRCRNNKEDPERLAERMGVAGEERPQGTLIWFHAASVGEAISTLILIDALKARLPHASYLVTTGTITSAQIMQKRLPESAIHQFYPLDHPLWVKRFLDHWRPDLVLWMESELWPNMLMDIKKREIPAVLLNARLSPKSLSRWLKAKKSAKTLLSAFDLIITQTEDDQKSFKALHAQNTMIGGNLKYAASPLPFDKAELEKLKVATAGRKLWLFASTHANEEEMAARIHTHLRKEIPGLLTVIVPRHPERRMDIETACKKHNVKLHLRSQKHLPPHKDDDLYIADTLGELGLFYRLAPVACIGRSFSNDGGGGHNPIEAAQLECAVLHGPLVQNLAQIYKDMDTAGASIAVYSEKDLQARLLRLFNDEEGLNALQNKALSFTQEKAAILETLIKALGPWLPAETPHNHKTGAQDQKCA